MRRYGAAFSFLKSYLHQRVLIGLFDLGVDISFVDALHLGDLSIEKIWLRAIDLPTVRIYNIIIITKYAASCHP